MFPSVLQKDLFLVLQMEQAEQMKQMGQIEHMEQMEQMEQQHRTDYSASGRAE